MAQKILIVDENPENRLRLRGWLQDSYEIHELDSCRAVETHLGRAVQPPDVVLLDLQLPDGPGETMIPLILRKWPQTRVMVLSDHTQKPERTWEAFRAGANAAHMKPADSDELHDYLQELLDEPLAITQAAAPICPERSPGGLMQISPAVNILTERLQVIAPSDCTVLVMGETGTGKEVHARKIHKLSGRKGKFIAVNCGGIVESLLEAELFGSVKGSYTGSTRDRDGKFRAAKDGTLFLDEIGEMRLDLQAKLLRVLQEREVTPVGDEHPCPINCRIIAATNVNLWAAVQQRKFREDLFHRMDQQRIELPPLRQRHAEILPLARSFLQEFAQQNKRKAQGFTLAAEQTLLNYPWPGNIRELSNVVLRAVFNCNEAVIDKRHLEFNDWDSWTMSAAHQQREKVLQTLIDCGFNKAEAAAKLGTHRATLYRWIQRLGIPVIKRKPGSLSRAKTAKGKAA